jgi:predicted  nucleic acid-binding Zn-ribbon protein
MREALQQKIDDLGTRINELRDRIEDAAELRDIESEYLQARERIDALGDQIDDQSDLALREAARALDELDLRLKRMQSSS